MTTKEYLSQISRLNRVIPNKLLEIAQLKELSQGISAIRNEERVQTTRNHDKIGTAYCKIEAMEEKIDEMIDEYVFKKELIISQIESMEDEVSYGVLFSRYIENNTFEKMADDMNYSFRQMTRLHGKALESFEKRFGHLYLEENTMS